MKRRLCIAVSAIAFAVLVASSDDARSQSTGSSAPILIGAAVSDTGTYAIEGKSTRRGYDMWADAVNARGGIDVGGTKRKVKIVYYDDESDPETAVKLVQRLISEDKVDFLFGPYSSGLTIATSAIAAKYKKLMFAGAAAATSVFDHKNLYVFSPLSLTTKYNTSALDALKGLGVKTIAIMHTSDAPMLDVRDATVKHAESLGMKVVSVQAAPVNVTDVTGAMRQMQAKAPDAFFMATGSTLTGILVMRTMRNIGWAPAYVSMVQAPTEATFVKELGAKNTDGVMAPSQWMPNSTYKDKNFGTAQDYYDTFLKKYGEKPSYLPPSASAAGESLQFAIEKAGSTDTEKVRQALLTLKADTMYGPISYSGPDHPSGLAGANVDRPMLTIQLDAGGKQVVVAPKDVAAAPVQKFKQWNAR
jgi:branched-chain amino acid transport system substrate-binding protein